MAPVPALLVLLVAADAGVAAPPPALACLARHYAVTPVQADGAWFAVLPDGTRLPFDDGRAKTLEQRLADPDVEDLFSIPYRAGAIRPVTAPDEDPGRIRAEAVLAATYGAPPSPALVPVRFLGLPVRIHRAVAPALERVAQRLQRARTADPGLGRFLRRLSGGFAARKIAGTDRTSAHAYGIAIDLDKTQSDYWRWEPSEGSHALPRSGFAGRSPATPTRVRWQTGTPLRWRNRIPQAIVDAFEAEGFIWGGRWYHYDTMHFEYRPELFPERCNEPVTSDSPRP
jgi:hypothetical protein